MLRTMGKKTLTGVAQPVLGDVLITTAINGRTPASAPTLITVANTIFYDVGDRIVIDPLMTYKNSYKITQILSATTMLGDLEGAAPNPHAVGAIIQWANMCGNVIVQPVPAGSGPVAVGPDNTVALDLSGKTVYLIEPVAAGAKPNDWQMNPNGGFNSCNSSEAWMIGAAGVVVLTYAWVF